MIIFIAHHTHVAMVLSVFICCQHNLLLGFFFYISPTIHTKQMVGGSPCWQAASETAVGWDVFLTLPDCSPSSLWNGRQWFISFCPIQIPGVSMGSMSAGAASPFGCGGELGWPPEVEAPSLPGLELWPGVVGSKWRMEQMGPSPLRLICFNEAGEDVQRGWGHPARSPLWWLWGSREWN